MVTFALPADVDADGKLDLVVGVNPTSTRVFPGLGDFSFGPPVELVTAQSPNDAVIADVNGDRTMDIVVATRTGQAISIFLNQGGLLFTAADVPLDRQANDVAAADLNRDGKVDLAIAAAGGGDGVTPVSEGFAYVLLGRGDGTFAQPIQYQVAPEPWQIALGDFTGDGVLDIATANMSATVQAMVIGVPGSSGSDTISILPGTSDGTFGSATSLTLATNKVHTSVRSLTAADVNGDQLPDLVVSEGALLLSAPANGSQHTTVTTRPL